MKKIILLLSLLYTSQCYANLTPDESMVFCKASEALAASAQSIRQYETSPSALADLLVDVSQKNPAMQKGLTNIALLAVQDADRHPIQQSQQQKQQAIAQFSQRYYAMCVSAHEE